MTQVAPVSTDVKKFGGLRIRKSGEASEDWGACIALYGPPGSGKTPIAATLAKSALYGTPYLYVDCEAGTRSIDHYTNIDFVDVQSWAQLQAIANDLKTKDHGYKTVCFDNLSEIRQKHMDSIVGAGGKPQIQDYGTNTTAIREFARFCRDLARNRKMNVIIILWDETEEDDFTGLKMKQVSLTRKLQTEVPGLLDTIGYVEVEMNGTRVINFANSKRLQSKFRRSATDVALQIPLQVVVPDPEWPVLADIVDTLRGGVPWPKEKYEQARKQRRVKTQEEQAEAYAAKDASEPIANIGKDATDNGKD